MWHEPLLPATKSQGIVLQDPHSMASVPYIFIILKKISKGNNFCQNEIAAHAILSRMVVSLNSISIYNYSSKTNDCFCYSLQSALLKHTLLKTALKTLQLNC